MLLLGRTGLPDGLPLPGSALLVGKAIGAFLAPGEAVKKGQAILTESENSWPLSEAR